jgi:hypothetical protein
MELAQEKQKRRKAEQQNGNVKQKFKEMRAFQTTVNKFVSQNSKFESQQTAFSQLTKLEAKTSCDSNFEETLPVFMRAAINEGKDQSNGEDTMQELFGSDGDRSGSSLRMEEDSFCKPRK